MAGYTEDEAVSAFNAFIVHNFVDPNATSPIDSLDAIMDVLSPLWQARARVVQHVLDPQSANAKVSVLEYYKQHTETAEQCIEGARAAAVFEEPETLEVLLKRAESLLQFHAEVSGVEVLLGPHQKTPRVRMAVLASTSGDSSSQTATQRPIEVVKLETNGERFDPPKYMDSHYEELSTSKLSDAEYLVLLLRASHTCLSNPTANTTVVNEQALPFIRRITETTDFDTLNFGVRERALYDRSVLEIKDIAELERGTVQLMKISRALHNGGDSDLTYFHQIVPLPWRNIDEVTARRLVAMSDFANAIPFYKRLGRLLDVAVCLTATGATKEALEVLNAPELQTNAKALLLRGDISGDPAVWRRVWDEHRDPRAKFRLAQRAIADNQLESAIVHANDVLSVQPSDCEALKLAASAAMQLNRWDAAADYLRRALAINDDDTRGWSDFATALLQTNQPQAAHHAIKQAIRVNQNKDPELPVYTNYVALSAQLGLYTDVLVGLTKLADAVDRGSRPYISKVSGVLPRLVASMISNEFSGTVPQLQLVELVTEKLPNAVADDDPMLNRLRGQVELWAQRYQQGLASLDRAVDLLFRDAATTITGPRTQQRIKLYAQEFAESLEKYGDKQGRIEGSKAYPGWQARKLSIEQKIKNL